MATIKLRIPLRQEAEVREDNIPPVPKAEPPVQQYIGDLPILTSETPQPKTPPVYDLDTLLEQARSKAKANEGRVTKPDNVKEKSDQNLGK